LQFRFAHFTRIAIRRRASPGEIRLEHGVTKPNHVQRFFIKGYQRKPTRKGHLKPGNIRITQFQQQKTARLDKNSPFELNQPTTPSAFGTLGARHANKAT